MRLRFGIGGADPCTLDQVGQLYDVTRERIRQIEAKAMRRLSNPARLGKLEPWLDQEPPKQTAKPAQHSDAKAAAPSFEETKAPADSTDSHDAEAAEAEEPTENADRTDPRALERLLARASELGIVVEQTGKGISRATWVNVDEPRDNQTRGIVSKLVAMGFMHWPGKGYWK